MPQDDRRPNPKVSEYENAQTMEVCPNCADLKPFGSRDCTCGMTHDEVKRVSNAKFVRVGDTWG